MSQHASSHATAYRTFGGVADVSLALLARALSLKGAGIACELAPFIQEFGTESNLSVLRALRDEAALLRQVNKAPPAPMRRERRGARVPSRVSGGRPRVVALCDPFRQTASAAWSTFACLACSYCSSCGSHLFLLLLPRWRLLGSRRRLGATQCGKGCPKPSTRRATLHGRRRCSAGDLWCWSRRADGSANLTRQKICETNFQGQVSESNYRN